MKEVVNNTDRLLVFDLNSYDDDGRIKAIYLGPRKSEKVTDAEARSRSLKGAEVKGLVVIVDLKSANSEVDKVGKEEAGAEKEPAKKQPKKDKNSDKENK